MLKLLNRFFNQKSEEISEFERKNPLGSGGERVDFIYDNNFDYSILDMYQKNHFKRYEYAMQSISSGEVCGDFACGSGYGSVMLSSIAAKVIGADLNRLVIKEIKKRYSANRKVEFINMNLLNLEFKNIFSSIISFETIEHFQEDEIYTLLTIFNKALKADGRIIISTPYMQEYSEAARTMGFHKTFNIDESKIRRWLDETGFKNPVFNYQDYRDHEIRNLKENPDFLICIAQKA